MKQDFSVFDKATFWKYALLLGVVCVLHKLTGGASFALFAPVAIAAVATGKREQSFFWILMIVTVMVGNANLLPKGFVFTVTHRATLCILGMFGFMRMLGKRKNPQIAPLLLILPYAFYMIIPSLYGWMPAISGLKLFLFAMVYMSYFAVANDVAASGRSDMRKLRAIVLVFACMFIFGSVILTRFPGYALMNPIEAERTGATVSLFMGMTMNPQCLGPVVASLTAIIYCDMLFGIKRAHPLYLALLVCTPYLEYLTSSRTGMGTYLAGIIFVSWIFMRSRGIGIGNNWKSKVTSGIMTTILILAFIVLCVPKVQQGISRFALKWTQEGASISDINITRIISSRQGLIDRALYNFKESPLIGNGFQVGEEMQYMAVDDWKQILTAPIEKGVWVTAILEEGGVIGMALFLLYAIGGGKGLAKRKSYTALSGLVVVLLTNLGEFTMFSMSYTGGFQLGMIFIGAALDGVRMRQLQDAKRNVVQINNIPVGYLNAGFRA